MPRSRNSRSSSPLKSLKTTTGQSEYDRIFQNVQEMFSNSVDADVIYYVLSECHWRSEEAIDKLLTIVERCEEQPIKSRSKLQEIAEGILGPLRHEEHQPPPAQQPLSSVPARGHFERAVGSSSHSKEISNEEHKAANETISSATTTNFQARGNQQFINAGSAPRSDGKLPSWEFPPLSSKMKTGSDDKSKSEVSKSGDYKPSSDSWRAIKAPKSSKHSSTTYKAEGSKSEMSKSGSVEKEEAEDVFSDDPAVMKARVDKPLRPRLEMNRNFPVRLLSKSPEELHEKISFPQTIHHSSSESVLSKSSKSSEIVQQESYELDETVIKCISEINNELLDETEKKAEKRSHCRSRSSSIRSQASENESISTGCSTPDPTYARTSTPSNQPMTLPVIGLSVEAPEFVPRPKKTKTEEIAQTHPDTPSASTTSSPLSSAPLKVHVDTKPIPIPVSSTKQGLSPVIRMGSPGIAVVSPNCAISPPSNISVTNTAHLTGSPMFITPKWQPVFQGIYAPQQPPPPLQPRLLPQQLPPSFRLPPPGTQFPPYSRVMFPVRAQPVFRVAGIGSRLTQVPMPNNVQMMTEMKDRVAMATGHPIMATGEARRPTSYPTEHETTKLRNEVHQSLEVCVETVKALTKAGKKILVILRGLPGSGKTTLARAVKLDGIVLSTDDYFTKGDLYEYDPDKLTEAHQWNRERAKEAIKMGTSPIVIDNTNTQKWEFKPYVSMAVNNNYFIEIMEPDTPWKFKPKELAKRTVHGVPEDQIQRMLSRYEKNLTVAVLSSNTKKSDTNGSADHHNGALSKENSPSPTLERKSRVVKSESGRRSRSRGKSSKVAVKRTKNPATSSSPVVDKSDANELQDWQISEEDRTWERQTESPITVQSIDIADTFTTDKLTDGEPHNVGIKDTDIVLNLAHSGKEENMTVSSNSNFIDVPKSGLSSVLSSQDEGSFYSCHSDIGSIASSKNVSPLIGFNVIESGNKCNQYVDETNQAETCQILKKKTMDIEMELSEEVLGYVDEVMAEHSNMNLSEFSVEDRNRIEEELKAFLQFYPINDEEQRRKAEILIGLKLSEMQMKCSRYVDTFVTEENLTAHCDIYEETELHNDTDNQRETDIGEQFIVHKEDPISNSTANNESGTTNDTEPNIDLDSSLNNEVANIFHQSELKMEVSSLEHIENETLNDKQYLNELNSNNLIERVDLDNSDDKNVIEKKTEQTEIKGSNISTDIVETESGTVLDSFYDFDSAIIRAKKSDVLETDSLFEIDSAIISASTESTDKNFLLETDSAIIAASAESDKDSLFEIDSAIIAASTDKMDTGCLIETDSAIIVAGKEVLDEEPIVVDDADIMKRLKASVEELKYWGQASSSEESLIDKVSTEWEPSDESQNNKWLEEENEPPLSLAKPQRQRRHKSGSSIGEKTDLNKFESNETFIQNKIHCDEESGSTTDSNYDEIGSERNSAQTNCMHINTVEESYIFHEKHQNRSSHLESEDCVSVPPMIPEIITHSETHSDNKSKIFNTLHDDKTCHAESHNYQIIVNESDQLSVISTQPVNEFHVPLPVVEAYKKLDSVADLPNRASNSELENSLFVSDDEEVTKDIKDAGFIKDNSDDYIFVSDDDMEYLNANKDNLNMISIQGDILVRNADSDNLIDNETTDISEYSKQKDTARSESDILPLNLQTEQCADKLFTESILTINRQGYLQPDNSDRNIEPIIPAVSQSETHIIPAVSESETHIIPAVSQSETHIIPAVSQSETEIASSAQNLVSPKKKKQQSKNRLRAKLQQPFFNLSDREKFASNNWSTFSSANSIGNNIENTNANSILQRNDILSKGTLTDSGDFRILNLYCQGESVEYVHEYKFVKTRSQSIDGEVSSNGELLGNRIPAIRTIDKSTSTEDLETDPETENIQFLKTCFPNISEDELDCVLLNCAYNVEWALNLLIDWKYHLDFTDEEKERFSSDILKYKQCSSPEYTVKHNEIVKESKPESLLNMCFKKIEKENIAAREDLEKQLIQTGKERLDRIEDDNITKIRLHRSTSLSESSLNASKNSLYGLPSYESVRRSVSDPHQNYDSVFSSSYYQETSEKSLISGDFLISPNQYSKSGIKGQTLLFNQDASDFVSDKIPRNKAEGLTLHVAEGNKCSSDNVKSEIQSSLCHVAIDNGSEAVITDNASVHDSVVEVEKHKQFSQVDDNTEAGLDLYDSGPSTLLDKESPVVFILTLDSNTIGQLEHLFGPLGKDSTTGHDDVEVPVNLETARLLHQCVKKGLQEDRQAVYKQLRADEEYARQLQEEQDLSERRGPRRAPKVSTPRIIPLKEIMEEELTKQSTQEELQKFLESEGGHAAIATRLKRKKLHESFPTIDTTLLDQIFQVNCYNLSETIESIKTSLSYQPVQTVMTREMELEYDRKLIEDIKQTSLDMLDNYEHGHAVWEDYEDVVDAEFGDYRGEATLHHKLRQECFQKAQEAYRKGLKQVASFYSQQGHLHTQKLKEANMRASEQILEDRHNDLETKMTLDLHGLHVDEAIAALDRILPQKERERYKSHLTLVTGRGRHSHHGVPRLRPAVLAYLQKHQYSFTELHPGAFRVTLKNR